MNRAYLLIGGNMGERWRYLHDAKQNIDSRCGKVKASSAVYETAAWGITDQPSFLNLALQIETPLTATELLQCLLAIEKNMGRIRDKKFGPRIIDIDILLFNEEVIREEGLTVPHPQLQNRRFALQCLHDIAADEVHPVLHKTIQQLLQECTDPLEVKKIDAN